MYLNFIEERASLRQADGLLNASARATIAQASLREVLSTMDAHLVNEASATIPLPSNKIDVAGILTHPEFSSLVLRAVHSMVAAIKIGTLKGTS